MELGQFLTAKRKNMHLTQEEMAEVVGVSKSAIAKWETNGGLPDRDNLKRIADIMNCSVSDLYRIIDNAGADELDMCINITPDIIRTLEAYGYKVIRPEEGK